MKAKTIKKVLRKRINDWIATIDSGIVRDAVRRDTIVTGGAIVSCLLDEPINDIDIYFKTAATTRTVAEYYAKKSGLPIFVRRADLNQEDRITIESAPPHPRIAEMVQPKPNPELEHQIAYISENAISLTGDIQIIIRFFGKIEEIHKNFDFVHTTCWYALKSHRLCLNKEALEAILTKELIYTGSLYPICSMFRIRKFIKRGWTITAGEVLKMALQISKLDLTDITVLRDQLVGVDALYFTQLLRKLEKGDSTNYVNPDFLINLINSINGDEDSDLV